MAQLLNLNNGIVSLNRWSFCNFRSSSISKLMPHEKSCSYLRNNAVFRNFQHSGSSCKGVLEVAGRVKSSPDSEACEVEFETLPHIQTLTDFPKEELVEKVVLVRFDSAILLGEELDQKSQSVSIFTIKYLKEAGAKVVLVSDWSTTINSRLSDAESVAGILSATLQCKVVTVQCLSSKVPLHKELFEETYVLLLENLSGFKEEVANSIEFAKLLSSGVDIFVNDSFSQSHRILASTVSVTRFCSACVAGFHFEESICQLKNVAKDEKRPYMAIIGGGNLYNKAAALHFLASICDVLIFVGMMSFQIMHALGFSVPYNLLEKDAFKATFDLIHFASEKSICILYPKDLWCMENHLSMQLDVFPAHGIPDGWVPVDLGPSSVEEINSFIKKCKKIIWIGPVKFRFSSQYTNGASQLARILAKQSESNCDVTVVGTTACKAITSESISGTHFNMVESASAVWEFLKGRKLPGVTALDRAYPFEIDWKSAYRYPTQPLVVDIGSGNGLFLLGMTGKRKDLNFLGLEINAKLVRCCLDFVHQSGITNGFFIKTNATSTFRSIVSSYPGQLVLVSIQCPSPDFNNPDNRWRMLQKSLVEAVADLLACDGKVFLQSDIQEVAVRMKEQFLKYGKGKFHLAHDQCDNNTKQGLWLEENPFGVRSDWEQHVVDRGAPMYRLMLSKSTSAK